MNKYKLHIKIAIVIIISAIIAMLIFNNNQNKKTWVAYFCSSSTDVMYDKGQALLIEFDSKGKVKSYDTDAYPFSGLVNFNDEIIFQTKSGLSKLNNNIDEIDININDNTVGYNMAGNLNKDTYYFLSNESFKDGYYSSKLILGDKETQGVYTIKGFVNSYGNDDNNIYLITDSMINKDNKQFQKISIDDVGNIATESVDIPYNIESNFKMIVTDEYIYAFVINDENKVSILKISSNSLKLEETIVCFTFNAEISGDYYYPISTNSIFLKDNKIYYPSMSGKVYSFNIDNNEFIEEFTFENYSMNSCLNSICCYDKDEIYVLYLNSSDKNYYLNCYNLKGKLKDKIELKLPDNCSKLYPHNFLKRNDKTQ